MILVFATLGALQGASRQIAGVAALAAAAVGAAPVGRAFGPAVSRGLGVSVGIGVTVTAVFGFFAVAVVVRLVLAWALAELFASKEGERTWDRGLGFALGASKAGLVAYLLVCTLVFADEAVSLGGKRPHFAPEGSWAVAVARRVNVLRLFGGPAAERGAAPPKG